MSNEYIFFYSNYDNASKNLKEKLIKHYELYKKFHLININDKRLKIPKFITHIPSLLITENGNTTVKCEPEASQWIREMTEPQQGGNGSIGDWDPTVMSGFSDNFSSLEDETVMDKNFSFVGRGEQKIYTPDSEQISEQTSGQPQQGQSQQGQPRGGFNSFNNQGGQGGFNGINSSGGFHGGQSRNVKKSKAETDFDTLLSQRRSEIPKPIARQ